MSTRGAMQYTSVFLVPSYMHHCMNDARCHSFINPIQAKFLRCKENTCKLRKIIAVPPLIIQTPNVAIANNIVSVHLVQF